MTRFVFCVWRVGTRIQKLSINISKRLRDGLRRQQKVINTAQTHIPYFLFKRRAVVSDDYGSDNGNFCACFANKPSIMVNFNRRANLVACYLLSFLSVLRRRQARRVPRRCAITSRTWWNGLSKWSSESSQTSQSSQTRDDHMDTLPGWSQTTRATEGIWMVWIELSGRRWSRKKIIIIQLQKCSHQNSSSVTSIESGVPVKFIIITRLMIIVAF